MPARLQNANIKPPFYKSHSALSALVLVLNVVLLWPSSAIAQDQMLPEFELPNILELDARSALSNIDDSEFTSLYNFESWNPDHPTILKILFRLANIQQHLMESFAKELDEKATNDILKQPDEYRAKVFRIEGVVTSIEEHSLLPRSAEGFGFDQYYIYQVDLGFGQSVKLLSTHKPRAWSPGKGARYPVVANAYFLHIVNMPPENQFVFASGHLQWYPTQADPKLNIGNGQLILSAMNIDIAKFDDIQMAHDQPIGAVDGAAMQEWIEAAGALKQSVVDQIDWEPVDLVDVLAHPTERTGDALVIRGIVRRISRVESQTDDGGKTYYYQLDMFYDLDDIQIEYSDRNQQTRKFKNSFPITVCTKRLPAGIEPGTDLKIPLVVRGFFFKLWSFQSEATKAISQQKRQTSPLFVAADVRVDSNAGGSAWLLSTFSFGVLIAALVICGGLVAWNHLGRFRPAKGIFRRKGAVQNPDEKVDLSMLDQLEMEDNASTT
jgi:hypothetical protein